MSGVPTAASRRVRRVVEVKRAGGIFPRALLGGVFVPGVGELRIEVGVEGHDLVGSSASIFELAAELLVVVVQGVLEGEDMQERVLTRLDAWP